MKLSFTQKYSQQIKDFEESTSDIILWKSKGTNIELNKEIKKVLKWDIPQKPNFLNKWTSAEIKKNDELWKEILASSIELKKWLEESWYDLDKVLKVFSWNDNFHKKFFEWIMTDFSAELSTIYNKIN